METFIVILITTLCGFFSFTAGFGWSNFIYANNLGARITNLIYAIVHSIGTIIVVGLLIFYTSNI